MTEWLAQALGSNVTSVTDWTQLVIRLGLAVLFGILVAGVYRITRGRPREMESFPGTLLLLCVLIAMVTQVIGDNVARAFSLVGALSIVRFRTVVQDTKDTAFVIFAVSVGMAIGAGQIMVAVGGTIAVTVACWIFRDFSPQSFNSVGKKNADPDSHPFDLHIRIERSPEAESQVLAALGQMTNSLDQIAVCTAKQGTALDLSFRLRLPQTTSLSTLVATLHRIELVQSVELRRARDDK